MKYSLRNALAAAALTGASLPLMAAPARPGTFTRTQPDGSQITLSLHGDEHFHYMMDREGYLVARQPDGWYRILDNAGAATSLLPFDATQRSAAEAEILSGIDPKQTFETLKTRALTNNIGARAAKAPALYRAGSVPPGKWDNADGHDLRAIPTDGERPVLVILVNFADLQWSFADDPKSEMTRMLNEPGYSGNYCDGSAADYFHASSNNVYQPSFDVYGPVTLPNPYFYYGRNIEGSDANPWEMVIDACNALDSEIDFAKYDTNGDGYVDNVFIFYAGYGENEGAGDDFVWPHAFNIRYVDNCPELDGVKVDHYACTNELTLRRINGDPKTHSGIGTFCHEFGHVLGLPDVYATSYTTAFTPGTYCVMDQGSYNNNSRTPPLYSIYEKYALEWEKPIDITEGADINMQPTVDGGYSYRVTIDPARPTEYYLFENRQKHSWDTFIPGHGMLVWHVDFNQAAWDSNVVNNNPVHQHLDVVEADGMADSGTQGGDTFPGISGISEFKGTGNPAFANWDGKTGLLDVTNIGEDVTGTVSLRFGNGGSPDSPLYTRAPNAVLTDMDDTSLSFKWEPVPGANTYYITALGMKVDDLFGTLETEFVDRYTFANLGDKTSVTLTDLKPGVSYQISLYAGTANNLSKPSQGFYSTYSSDLESTVPLLEVIPDADSADLKWYEVNGADHYEVTVATRTENEPELGQTVAWDNRKAPSDWMFPGGTFDNRSEYVGESSPSLRLYNETAITTGIYDKDITSIDFWARTNVENGNMSLRIYAVSPDFSLSQIAEVKDIVCSENGQKVEIKDFPTGVRQLMIVFQARTAGLQMNMDDIHIYYSNGLQDTPVNGYDAYRVDGNTFKAQGLQKKTDYVAYMRAVSGSGQSRMSQSVKFTTAESSGIEGIMDGTPDFSMSDGVVTSAEPVDIYTIDGRAIALRAKGSVQLPAKGIYLVQSAGKTTKIVW